jgi:diguanylate cyclase (GGDEF)-like protein
VLDLIGAVASVGAARRGINRLSWVMYGVARAFGVANTVFLAAAYLGGGPAFWWIGTLSRYVTVLLFSAGLLIVPLRRLSGGYRHAFVAEIATVLAGGFMLTWYFVLDPVMDGNHPSRLWLVSAGFPVLDLLLLMAVTAVLMRGVVNRLLDPIAALLGGLALFLVVDVVWSYLRARGVQGAGTVPASFCMVLAHLLMTVAPMLVSAGAASTTDRVRRAGPPRWVGHLPLAALGAGGALMLIITIREDQYFPWGGLVVGLVAMTAAVAWRQALSVRMSHAQVASDALTGLANRVGLHSAVGRAVRHREEVALLLLDLDGFKLINDVYGHDAGDAVLVEFGHLLRSVLRTADVAARIGGDEFAVLLADVATAQHAVAAAQRILAATARNPVRLGDDRVPIRASIGIATGAPEDTTKSLLRRADVAMYQAKRSGSNSFTVYHPEMTDRRAEDAQLAEALETALARGELRVLYQPIVGLADGDAIAAEALLRWEHPTLGSVSPARFIPVAERSGEIIGIGLWVLEQACLQVRRWQRYRPVHVSVNLSPRQLQEPAIVRDILAVLQRTGVDPGSLVLEVTESAVVDEKSGIAALRELRAHGIRIAVDDFGTGYSSLQYLTRLPVDVLKIDRAFVAQLNGTREGAAIVEAVIRLAQVLHLTTVAEGVETAEQAAELLLLGCDTGQGYLFARPADAAQLGVGLTAVRP